jgi:hypothetical protein
VGDSAESSETIECSGRLTFECVCGERLILLGLKEDCLSEQRMNLECDCGRFLTLIDLLKEEVFELGQLVRGTFKIPGASRQ